MLLCTLLHNSIVYRRMRVRVLIWRSMLAHTPCDDVPLLLWWNFDNVKLNGPSFLWVHPMIIAKRLLLFFLLFFSTPFQKLCFSIVVFRLYYMYTLEEMASIMDTAHLSYSSALQSTWLIQYNNRWRRATCFAEALPYAYETLKCPVLVE